MLLSDLRRYYLCPDTLYTPTIRVITLDSWLTWSLSAWSSGRASVWRVGGWGSLPVFPGQVMPMTSHATVVVALPEVWVNAWTGLSECLDWLALCQYIVTWWGSKFDLQLQSQCGSMYNCLRSLRKALHVTGVVEHRNSLTWSITIDYRWHPGDGSFGCCWLWRWYTWQWAILTSALAQATSVTKTMWPSCSQAPLPTLQWVACLMSTSVDLMPLPVAQSWTLLDCCIVRWCLGSHYSSDGYYDGHIDSSTNHHQHHIMVIIIINSRFSFFTIYLQPLNYAFTWQWTVSKLHVYMAMNCLQTTHLPGNELSPNYTFTWQWTVSKLHIYMAMNSLQTTHLHGNELSPNDTFTWLWTVSKLHIYLAMNRLQTTHLHVNEQSPYYTFTWQWTVSKLHIYLAMNCLQTSYTFTYQWTISILHIYMAMNYLQTTPLHGNELSPNYTFTFQWTISKVHIYMALNCLQTTHLPGNELCPKYTFTWQWTVSKVHIYLAMNCLQSTHLPGNELSPKYTFTWQWCNMSESYAIQQVRLVVRRDSLQTFT